MKNIAFFLLIFLASFSLKGQSFLSGKTYYSEKEYIAYFAGNMPLILTVPHGGLLVPSTIPNRNCSGCVTVMDTNTQELGRLIADEVKTLAKNEVTAPIFLNNSVAVFQMRGIDEKGAPEPILVFVDYALIGTKDTAILAQMEGSVDTCDDLYEFSKNDPTILINRNSQARSSLAPDVALAISKIDLGEFGPLSDGAEAQAVVLCNLLAQN